MNGPTSQLALPISGRDYVRTAHRVAVTAGLTPQEGAERGMAEVAEAADRLDPHWKDRMLDAVRQTARELPDFICDDVWLRAAPADRAFPKPKALGLVMRRALKLKIIEKSDLPPRTSNHPHRHASPVTVWRSKLLVADPVKGAA